MQELNENIIPYKLSHNCPSIAWKVILRTALPASEDFQDHDVSDRLMNEPNIIDAAEYRENLTYINEVSLKFNNENKFLTSDAGSGILDIYDQVEIFIEGYYDIENGHLYPVRKFGGWLDKNRIKADSVNLNCEAVGLSYFGMAERKSGSRICRKYFTDLGQALFSFGRVFLTNAAIIGKPLKKGIHYLYSQLDGSDKQMKLDDGEFITINDGLNVLSNADDTERVEIYFGDVLGHFKPDQETILIVKTEGEQYPFTFFHNANLTSIVKKAFEEIGVTNYTVQNYEFPTFDGRDVMSFYEAPDEFINSDFEFINCIAGDGDRYTYIGYKNEVWRRDMHDGSMLKIAEGLDGYANRLVIDDEIYSLFVFAVDDVTWNINHIYHIDLSDFSLTNILTNNDAGDDLKIICDFQLPFSYSYYRKTFLFLCRSLATNTPKLCELVPGGTLTTIVSDASLLPEGFNCVWQDGAVTRYYFLRNGAYGSHTLSRISFTGSWSGFNDQEAWYLGATNLETVGIVYEYGKKVLVKDPVNNKPYFYYDFQTNGYGTGILEPFTQLLGGIEWRNLLWFVRYDEVSLKYQMATFDGTSITVNDQNLYAFETHRGGYENYMMTINKNYKGYEVLNIQATNYNLMIRFSNWIIPGIYGYAFFNDQTIRDVFQELSNTFLGFVRVDPLKNGLFVSRAEYTTDLSVEFKREYNKTRVKERIYSEVYDGVRITIGEKTAMYGDTGIEAKILDVNLKYIDPVMIKDIGKYMYDYYQIPRKLMTIQYLPTFLNVETLDRADLSDYSLADGIVHRVAPKKNICEIDIVF